MNGRMNLNFNFGITIPFRARFKGVFTKEWTLPIHNLGCELQIALTDDLVTLSMHLQTSGMHPSFGITIGVVGYTIDFLIYDIMHAV